MAKLTLSEQIQQIKTIRAALHQNLRLLDEMQANLEHALTDIERQREQNRYLEAVKQKAIDNARIQRLR